MYRAFCSMSRMFVPFRNTPLSINFLISCFEMTSSLRLITSTMYFRCVICWKRSAFLTALLNRKAKMSCLMIFFITMNFWRSFVFRTSVYKSVVLYSSVEYRLRPRRSRVRRRVFVILFRVRVSVRCVPSCPVCP